MTLNNKKSIISCDSLSTKQINELFKKTDSINIFNYNDLSNKILINVFFEPSTRTQLSFECAMYKLGGKVINFQKNTSSLNKGESFEDTIKTLSIYADVMVLRHPKTGKVELADKLIDIPVINAGDGSGEHPTQALIDLYTIYKQFQENYIYKSILFVGDLKNSRTIHSLVKLINLYPSMKIYTLSYEGLEPEQYFLENISKIHKQRIDEIQIKIEKIDYKMFDIIYVTRLQKERLTNNKESYQTNFILNNSIADKMKEDSIIMHPLPRNNEISTEIDNNPRCAYFKQVEYGIELRTALLELILK